MPVSEKTKEIILNVARDLFAQKGFYKTTYADIARHAGVNQATVYRGFNTKENIFRLLIEEEYSEITRATYHSYQEQEPIPHKLRRLINTNLKLTIQSRILKYILRDEYSQFRSVFNSKEKKALDEIRRLIEEGIAKGEIKNEDPAFLLSVMHSFRYCLLNLYKNEKVPLESKYSMEHLIETINNIFVEGFINYFTQNHSGS